MYTEENRDGARGAASASPARSSRESLGGAGWRCESASVASSVGRPFSWLNPAPLWQSRNQVLGRFLGDPTNEERRRWMRLQEESGNLPEDLILDRHAGSETVSFIVVGDTGEGDASQYAVVEPLLARGADTDFMVVCSDVIYPAGDAEDYEPKFYEPYKDYPSPIYALPGNHDWYDGLAGFMYHLCDARTPPATEAPPSLKGRVRQRLWRRPQKSPTALPERRRTEGQRRSQQRSPYFAVETGPLLVVAVDTGMGDAIDREQGEWLRKVSRRSTKPKLLITGKPLYVDGEHHPGPIEGGGTVDDIVRNPEHNYVAAIGGDIHNYQRYSVNDSGRSTPLYYIVSGGGGAYMSATHRIPKVYLDGVGEEDFVCYPRRGDSLSFYSKLYDGRFGLGKGLMRLSPEEAAAYMGQRLGIEPTRPGDRAVHVSERVRRVAERIFPLPGRGRGPLHHLFSEFFDWNDPPLFKNFLRLDASEGELRIRCFAATGCAEHESDPPLEDEVRIPLTR